MPHACDWLPEAAPEKLTEVVGEVLAANEPSKSNPPNCRIIFVRFVRFKLDILNMQLPVKITYRGLDKTDEIDDLVMTYAARLDKFCDHINRCDVAIEQPNHTHHKGNPYRCRIDVTVARGHEVVADERQMDNGSHQALNKVIHDAFKTMERELRRVVDKQRRDVKTHADTRSPK